MQAALPTALRSRHPAGADLDVTWSESIDPEDPLLRENVSLTPRIGAVTVESHNSMAATFVANAIKLDSGESLNNLAC